MQARSKPHSLVCARAHMLVCLLHIWIGFVQGRVVEIFGPEASGKTTLALHVIAEAQKQGGYVLNAHKISFNSVGSSSY